MDVVPAKDTAGCAARFAPERPGGAMIAAHVAQAGVGRFRVDRLDAPQVVLAELPGNAALRGDPACLPPDALDGCAGFVAAPAEFLPVLRAADPGVAAWDRLVFELPADVGVPGSDAVLLGAADAPAIAAFEADGAWIHETWGSPAALAASGLARGVFVDGRLVSIAATFYLGTRYEELGVVTDSAHRRRGHSSAAAAALIADIRARGRVPVWSTSPDNASSLAVAHRLGFRPSGTGVLYALRVPIPVSS
ncbi:GNAT family N-acetyltransferase [Pseudonocardia sp. CA-107938]|uniref:GNAT family N-acetyltransferase n=1 Tax=Pseudonocardia sp. CA-107938 TaxID=3240021 RepID=UPI003D94AED8